MKARLAKKIWSRRVDHYSAYWWQRMGDFAVTKVKFDHRIAQAKRIYTRSRIKQIQQ